MTRILPSIGTAFVAFAGKQSLKNHKLNILFGLAILALSSSAAIAGAGDDLQLAQYRGKVVVVDFWASWCAPCRRSFPWMNAMQAKYGGEGLVIVAVNVDRERSAADRFLAEVPADFRIYYDNQGAVAEEFGVAAMPSSFVIGRDGSIIAQHMGFKVRKQDEYEAIIVEALGDTP